MNGFGPVEPRAERAGVPRRLGARAPSRSRCADGACPAAGTSTVALRPREPAAGRLSVDELLRDLVRRRWSKMLTERGLVAADEIAAGHALHPPKPVKRALSRRRRRADACSAAGRPSANRQRRRASRSATRCAPRTSIRTTHTRLPRYVRGQVGIIERVHRLPRVSRQQRARRRRESAMALHRAVRRPRTVGRRRRPDGARLGRRLRALSGAGLMQHRSASRARCRRSPCPASRATTTARCSASRGRRRPSRWRWRCTSAACSPGRNGRRRSAPRSSARRRRRSRHRRDLLLALARDAGDAGRRQGRGRRTRRCTATATPGITLPIARRTASRSSRAEDFLIVIAGLSRAMTRSYAHQSLAHHVAGEQGGTE